METEIQTPNYYAVITADVRYADIPSGAKLLYGEISALTSKEGYCWASNGYFAKLYGVDNRTITRWIKALTDIGVIQVKINKADGNTRQIRLDLATKKSIPSDKKVQHNNTSNTTKNITNSNELVTGKPEKYGNPEINELFESFTEATGLSINANIKENRRYAHLLIKKHGLRPMKAVMPVIAMTQDDQYAPRIKDFKTLHFKWNDIALWYKQKTQAKKGVVDLAEVQGGGTEISPDDL